MYNIWIKISDGIMKVLSYAINLISLEALDSNRCRYSREDRTLEIIKWALVVIKG